MRGLAFTMIRLFPALLCALVAPLPLTVVAAALAAPAPVDDWRVEVRWTTDRAVTLWWERPDDAESFKLAVDGTAVAGTAKTHATLSALAPGVAHRVTLMALDATGRVVRSKDLPGIALAAPSRRLDVRGFGADATGRTLATSALQRAIDAARPGDTLSFPAGTYRSGALFLKSDLTLVLEAGAVLQGSTDPNDYPIIRSRFEGWECDTYASLLNGGTLGPGAQPIGRVAINGPGRIVGGGGELADAMVAARGRRSRGRLISFINAHDIDVAGVTCAGSPSWTLHFIYSERINCRDLDIRSDVRNGDGIDPDSARDMWIFNCRFNTSDDCIAIKSGKNPEGNVIARPSENIWITDCRFETGHGISIGSEISGGVRGVRIRDCEAGPLKFGLQIKATRERGGYVEDVHVSRCRVGMIRILTELPYNNDGAAAPLPPVFHHFIFERLDMRVADTTEPLIEIHGFPDRTHWTRDLRFHDIMLPEAATIKLRRAERVVFERVRTVSNHVPEYVITESEAISR